MTSGQKTSKKSSKKKTKTKSKSTTKKVDTTAETLALPDMEENFGDKINTNGFDKRPEDAKKGGRKPKIYTQLKELGYSKDDIKACFGELIFYKEN